MIEKKMKGFAFTLDAFFATIIALSMITVIYHFAVSSQRDYFVEMQLASFANDILVVLNKYGTLDTLNENQIESVLQQVLPDNYAAEIKIKSYKYQNEFSLEETVVATYPDMSVPMDVVRARNNFLTFANGKISRYNIAEIRLWLR